MDTYKGKKWSDELIEELIRFPNAAHDDQVDAMTMAIHYMKESWHLTHPDDPEWEERSQGKEKDLLDIYKNLGN